MDVRMHVSWSCSGIPPVLQALRFCLFDVIRHEWHVCTYQHRDVHMWRASVTLLRRISMSLHYPLHTHIYRCKVAWDVPHDVGARSQHFSACVRPRACCETEVVHTSIELASSTSLLVPPAQGSMWKTMLDLHAPTQSCINSLVSVPH
jgi:hypothetical protein